MDDGGPASKRAKTTAAHERVRSTANKQVCPHLPWEWCLLVTIPDPVCCSGSWGFCGYETEFPSDRE